MVKKRYYAKRFLMWAVVVYASITLTFIMIRFIPGGPQQKLMQEFLRKGMEYQQAVQRAEALISYDVSDPIWKQYLDYVTGIVFHLDFGESIFEHEPVMQVYARRIPWSMYLMVTSLGINFLSGIALGGLMAYKEGSKFDLTVTTYMTWSNAVPYFIAALLLVILFGYQTGWFPTGGRYDPSATPGFNVPFLSSVLYHAALPLFSLILTGFGGPAIQMRANSIRTLGRDHIRVAKLRGLPTNRIALRYVARNAVLPMYTGLVMAMGTVMGGSIILEEIFQYPGMGLFMYSSIVQSDYPAMMGGFVIMTVGLMTGILIADLTYEHIDPRAGSGESREAY